MSFPPQPIPPAKPTPPTPIPPVATASAPVVATRLRAAAAAVSAPERDAAANLRAIGWKAFGQRLLAEIQRSDLTGRSAQLAYYFFFSLFPMLIAASSIVGIAAKTTTHIDEQLLDYFASIIPPSAFDIVNQTFHQTTHASTGIKVVLGILTALWSASVGTSALQDALNTVYCVKETRSYVRARIEAIGLTLLMGLTFFLSLAVLFLGDQLVQNEHHGFGLILVGTVRTLSWPISFAITALGFSAIYYLAPDTHNRRWDWISPGAIAGLVIWLLASTILRIYLHYFNSYSVTYGSLGAVIVLLTWFYLSGIAILTGATINSLLDQLAGENAPRSTAFEAHHMTS